MIPSGENSNEPKFLRLWFKFPSPFFKSDYSCPLYQPPCLVVPINFTSPVHEPVSGSPLSLTVAMIHRPRLQAYIFAGGPPPVSKVYTLIGWTDD